MYSDDVYRAQLRSTFADLRQALALLEGAAKVSVEFSDQGARLMMVPFAKGACPVELMVRADQHYDIAVGAQLYEDRPVERLELFKPLILAIVDGAVVERVYTSALTGRETGRETIVTMPFGSRWSDGRGVRQGEPAERVAKVRQYLPYRR